MTTQQKSLIVWGCFLLLTLVWGSSFILVKRSLQGGFSADEVASLRMVAAFVVLIVPASMALRHIPRSKLYLVVLSGWLSMFVPAYLFAYGQVYMPSSVVSILNALTPACTFIAGVIAYQQPMKAMQVLGLLVGFIGSALLIVVNAQGTFSFNVYALLIIAATVCYGINVNMVKYKLNGVRPIHFSTVAVAVAGISAIIYLLFSGKLPHIRQNAIAHPWALGAVVLLGALGTALAQVVFNYMLTLTTSVFASAITYFIPIVAVLWGLWDGEVLYAWHYLGMACIIGGILILNRAR